MKKKDLFLAHRFESFSPWSVDSIALIHRSVAPNYRSQFGRAIVCQESWLNIISGCVSEPRI